MTGWYLSEQARQALWTTRSLARGRRAVGSADSLLVAILGQWDDEQAAGPALLRACGMTADQASQLATTLLPTEPAEAAVPEAEPRIIGTLRFVLDQAERIAVEARASVVGTEHLVVAILWLDTHAARELRRHGVSYALALERLATLPATEQAEWSDPLEEAEVPTPAAAMLGELARQQAEQHPVEGDGRITSLHHLLALLMLPRGAANRLLGELGVDYEDLVRRIEEEGARRVRSEDWRPEELPVEGWVEFRVTDEQDQAIRRRFHAVHRQLRRQGVRYMFGKNMDDPEWFMVRIHPGASGLDPREVLDRLLGRAS